MCWWTIKVIHNWKDWFDIVKPNQPQATIKEGISLPCIRLDFDWFDKAKLNQPKATVKEGLVYPALD